MPAGRPHKYRPIVRPKIEDWQIRDFILCQGDFLFFVWPSVFGDKEDKDKQFVFIDDPQLHQAVPFEPWPHLIEFAKSLLVDDLLLLIKSRQEGASWIIAIHRLWQASFHEMTVCLKISQGEDEAKELLDKARTVHRNLPDHLRLPLSVDNTEELSFLKSKGAIKARPSTSKAGHGVTATSVALDEFEFHQYASESLRAIKPTIDAGGQIVALSTVDKTQSQTTFKGLVRAGMRDEQGVEHWDIPLSGFKGANGWRLFFWPFDVRPGRDEVWYQAKLKEIANDPTLAKDGLTPELYMEENYPRTLREALSPATSLRALDHKVLDSLSINVIKPMEVVDGVINIYSKYVVGQHYTCFTDTSHGVGGDDAVSGIMDVRSGRIVADIMSNNLSPDSLSFHTVKMLALYNNPLWGIEDNDWGVLTIARAKDMGYTNFFYREWQKEQKRVDGHNVGWHTGPHESKERLLMIGEGIAAINAGEILVHNELGHKQMYDIIRNPKKGGRVEAQEGCHDDYFIMVCGNVQMRKYIQFTTGKGSNTNTMGQRKGLVGSGPVR